MPPAKKKQPTEAVKLANWLEQTLLENDKPGGTIVSRLSKEEYEKSVSNLPKIPFTAPSGFPPIHPLMALTTMVENLFFPSPMAQYLEIATPAADQVLPPKDEPRKVQKKSSSFLGNSPLISPRDTP